MNPLKAPEVTNPTRSPEVVNPTKSPEVVNPEATVLTYPSVAYPTREVTTPVKFNPLPTNEVAVITPSTLISPSKLATDPVKFVSVVNWISFKNAVPIPISLVKPSRVMEDVPTVRIPVILTSPSNTDLP